MPSIKITARRYSHLEQIAGPRTDEQRRLGKKRERRRVRLVRGDVVQVGAPSTLKRGGATIDVTITKKAAERMLKRGVAEEVRGRPAQQQADQAAAQQQGQGAETK